MHIYYFIFSLDQESGHGLAWSSSESHVGQSRQRPRKWSYLRLNWGRIYSKLIWLLEALSFLQAARLKVLRVLGAFGWRKPSVTCHVAFSIGQLKTWEFVTSKPARERSSQQNRYYTVLCNHIITYTYSRTFYYLCYILLIRKQVTDPAHIQGEGITQGHEHWEAKIMGVTLESAPTR